MFRRTNNSVGRRIRYAFNNHRNLNFVVVGGPVLFALLGLLLVGVVGCTDESGARRAAAASGLTITRFTGYRFFGCADDDSYHTGFEAQAENGRTVTGVVCSGWFKGNTVRID